VVATADYIQKNGPTIKAFNAALDKAVVWIENPSNKDALIALAAQRTGQSADVVKAAIFPTYYSSGMKESSVQWLLNLCKQYGLVDKVPGVDVVVDPNALK
jgi:ABC-type nitrate/sulfonate/bicarbonate transport system substrate-binding protein